MPKLFVAVDLPLGTRELLDAVVGIRHPGLRLTPPEDLHLTLHYIGEGDTELHASALAQCHVPGFDLTLGRMGSFAHRQGQRTLWMGVLDSQGLKRLHRSVANALATVGFLPELRSYTPHISLARASASFSEQECDRAMALDPGPWPPVRITTFSLYSSHWTGDMPHYHCERTFRLDML